MRSNQKTICMSVITMMLTGHSEQTVITKSDLESLEELSTANFAKINMNFNSNELIKTKLSSSANEMALIRAKIDELRSSFSTIMAEVTSVKQLTTDLRADQAAKVEELKATCRSPHSANPGWEASDQKRRPTWPILITKTVKAFSTRSSAFRTILKSVLSARMAVLSGWASRDVPTGSSLSETLTNVVKASLNLNDEEYAKTPSQASYDAYRALINDVKHITNQKLLQKEVDENEATIKASGKKTDVIRKWTLITVIAVILALIVLVVGFTAWFGYVCKKTQADEEASARRAEVRLRREAEGRVAAQVAHELQPFVPAPSAPLHPQAPRIFPQ